MDLRPALLTLAAMKRSFSVTELTKFGRDVGVRIHALIQIEVLDKFVNDIRSEPTDVAHFLDNSVAGWRADAEHRSARKDTYCSWHSIKYHVVMNAILA